MIIITAPIICHRERLSYNINSTTIIETTVAAPMNDEVRFTPIFAIATFDRKMQVK